MKDKKTIIAVLIALVVVIVAFYIRISPPAETPAPATTDNQTPTGETTPSETPSATDVPVTP